MMVCSFRNETTGKLHLGHLVGVLENWKKLQEKYNCYFL
jgi:tryptophanyl-tRNA synthetase